MVEYLADAVAVPLVNVLAGTGSLKMTIRSKRTNGNWINTKNKPKAYGVTVVPVTNQNKETIMKAFIANDQPGFKLRVTVADCAAPDGLKHLVFTGEQYDSEGTKTQESSYNFFLTKDQIISLGENLKNAVA